MINLVERRSNERVKVMLSATVAQDGAASPARLANLSAEGALVIGTSLTDGTPVLLQRNGADVRGSVTWASGNRCGVKFHDVLDVGAALRTIRKPRAKSATPKRRPGLKCIPLTQAEKINFDRWVNIGPQILGG